MTDLLATRLRAPAAVAAGGAALAAALVLRDPHAAGSWGFCPFLALTGLPCPGCGGLRATHDLLVGRPGDALASNGYAVFTAVLAVLALASWGAASLRGRRPRWFDHASPLASAWFLGLVAFGVLRWLPGLGVLGP